MDWLANVAKEVVKFGALGPVNYFVDMAIANPKEDAEKPKAKISHIEDKQGLEGIIQKRPSRVRGIEEDHGQKVVVIRSETLTPLQMSLYGKIKEAVGRSVEARNRFNQTNSSDPQKKQFELELYRANQDVANCKQAFKQSVGLGPVSRFMTDTDFDQNN